MYAKKTETFQLDRKIFIFACLRPTVSLKESLPRCQRIPFVCQKHCFRVAKGMPMESERAPFASLKEPFRTMAHFLLACSRLYPASVAALIFVPYSLSLCLSFDELPCRIAALGDVDTLRGMFQTNALQVVKDNFSVGRIAVYALNHSGCGVLFAAFKAVSL